MPTAPATAWISRRCSFLACLLAGGGVCPLAWAEPEEAPAEPARPADPATGVPRAAFGLHAVSALSLRLAPVEITANPALQDFQGTTLRLDVTRWIRSDSAGSLGMTFSTLLPAQAEWRPGGLPVAAWGADIGVRWRTPLSHRRHLDMTAWTRAAQPGQPPDTLGMIWMRDKPSDYGARVELQWSSSRTGGLAPEFGAIGVQLEGQSRLLLRARRGGPMLYYRTKF